MELEARQARLRMSLETEGYHGDLVLEIGPSWTKADAECQDLTAAQCCCRCAPVQLTCVQSPWGEH